jgi:zinc protease
MRERPRTKAAQVVEYAQRAAAGGLYSWHGPRWTTRHAPPDGARRGAVGRSSRLYRSLVYDSSWRRARQLARQHEDAGFFSATRRWPRARRRGAEAALAPRDRAAARRADRARGLAEAKTGCPLAELFSRETAQGRAFALGQAIVATGDPTYANGSWSASAG